MMAVIFINTPPLIEQYCIMMTIYLSIPYIQLFLRLMLQPL